MKSIKGLIVKDLLNLNHYKFSLFVMVMIFVGIGVADAKTLNFLPIMLMTMVGMIGLSTFNYDEISNDERSIILMFNGGTLNNHIVNFEGNTVKSDKANVRKNLLYLLNLSDTSPQTIKFINNIFNGYTMSWRAENQDKHNVVISEYN